VLLLPHDDIRINSSHQHKKAEDEEDTVVICVKGSLREKSLIYFFILCNEIKIYPRIMVFLLCVEVEG